MAVSSDKPSLLSDGRTVRFYLTGTFVTGAVVVSWTGAFKDTAGNTGQADAQAFKLIERLQAPANPAQTPDKVFFIEISGGMELRAAGLFEETDPATGLTKPLLAIRGKVRLEFGNRTLTDASGKVVTDAKATRSPACASASTPPARSRSSSSATSPRARRDFVLETGDGLSDLEFWGVAAFASQLRLPRAVRRRCLQGSALLQINTTAVEQIETISLEGIPGGVLFVDPDRVDELDPGLAADRHVHPGRRARRARELLQDARRACAGAHDHAGQRRDPAPGAVGPDRRSRNATIEGTVAGKKWRITKRRQPVLHRRSRRLNGAAVLLVRGEQRTYTLAPESLSVEIVGGLRSLNDKAVRGRQDELVHIDGGFFI